MQRNARRAAFVSTRTPMRSSHTASKLRLFASLVLTLTAAHADARERQLLDANWKFHFGDADNAQQLDFDDSAWRPVNLPHDWSIEGAPQADAPAGGAGAYLPTSVGWYRRHFITPSRLNDQRLAIEFEGVYHRCEVWLNGQPLGRHAYGYTPFTFDLTPHLNPAGESNVLAVRVDNSAQPNCRWYSGSGIYRHVWAEAIPPVHVDRNELRIHTHEVTPNSALLVVQVAVQKGDVEPEGARVDVELRDASGASVAQVPDHGRTASLPPTTSIGFEIPNPKLWTPDSPYLYTLATRIVVDDRVIDELLTPVGIRTVKVTPERGLELNGQPIKLIGACVHHDHGPLGAASFDRAEERKVEMLKRAGFNAVRTAHNPPSTAFLDACDRLGLLVLDEAFDGWKKQKTPHDYHEDFDANWQADLKAFIRRDRNHPSVIMWSIGNEMFERGEPSAVSIARDMAAVVRRLDPSRPITLACNHLAKEEDWPKLDPLFAEVDVAGYNYELDQVAPDSERLPQRMMLITESFLSEAFAAWEAVNKHPALIGDFVWTGMDYLGEAGLGRVFPPGEQARDPWVGPPQFPAHGATCGDIDLTGLRKPVSHYRNIVWDRGENLYVAVITPAPDGGKWNVGRWGLPPAIPSWTWPGHEGRELEVVVFSRHPAVRLYLNDRLVGEQLTGELQKFQATFRLPFEPGQLSVRGVDAGEVKEAVSLATAAEATQIKLRPDRTDLVADGQDLAFVTVEVADDRGLWRPDAAVSVEYRVEGPGEIIGVASADLESRESYQANPRRTYQGRSLVVVRTTDEPGEITITASSPGLESTSFTMTSTAP
jgi:beta-galactosidase